MKRNTIEKQKTALTIISIIAILLGIAVAAGGIVLIISMAKKLIGHVNAWNIVGLIGGIFLSIGGIIILIAGIYYLFISRSIKATRGSIAMGNLGKGTVNMIKCSNCGHEVSEDDKCCPNCGHSLASTTICPKCGCTNQATNKKCSSCGEDLQ